MNWNFDFEASTIEEELLEELDFDNSTCSGLGSKIFSDNEWDDHESLNGSDHDCMGEPYLSQIR